MHACGTQWHFDRGILKGTISNVKWFWYDRHHYVSHAYTQRGHFPLHVVTTYIIPGYLLGGHLPSNYDLQRPFQWKQSYLVLISSTL